MIRTLVVFSIVQMLMITIGIFGGLEFGTFDAGMMCAASIFIGVVCCIIDKVLVRS